MVGGPAVLRFSRGLPPTKQYGERLRLLVRQGQDQGTCYSLLGDLLFVGREDCQIVLNDTNISRKHAEISWKGDHYVIRDLGSSNGIVYNGNKVPETKLNPGDIVLMGLTVVEVYPPGQTRKNEKPMLAAPIKRLAAVPSPEAVAAAAAAAAAAQPKLTQKEERERKRKVERKRMLLIVGVFFALALAYFNDDNATMRQHTRIQQAEDDETPRDKKTGLPIDNTADKIKNKTKQIQEMKTALVKLQADRAALEEREKTTKNLSSEALIEDANTNPADKQQHKDAEIFFRNGVRELQNKNYRRAFTAFDTALTVDPQHELAKIYLKSAKMELLSELWSTQVAGLRAKASLRYKEARMHFENIVRYLDNEQGGNSSMENEANKELRELYEDAKKEIGDLDTLEKKDK
jgi:pSer/pThr/pTyr-binding forkhead associated (FHA) protein